MLEIMKRFESVSVFSDPHATHLEIMKSFGSNRELVSYNLILPFYKINVDYL